MEPKMVGARHGALRPKPLAFWCLGCCMGLEAFRLGIERPYFYGLTRALRIYALGLRKDRQLGTRRPHRFSPRDGITQRV